MPDWILQEIHDFRRHCPLGEMNNYIKNGVYESDIGNMILHVVANLQSFSPLLSTDK